MRTSEKRRAARAAQPREESAHQRGHGAASASERPLHAHRRGVGDIGRGHQRLLERQRLHQGEPREQRAGFL
jgi:hypothetical protein